MFSFLSKVHTNVLFSPSLQGQQGWELVGDSEQCPWDPGGRARRGRTVFRAADFPPRRAGGREQGAPGTTINTIAVWWFSAPLLGSYFLCKTTVILMGCHLLVKVIWEFSQQTDHKIGPCIMFRILSFNKTFYKLSVYLLTSNCSSRGPAAYPVVYNALTAIGEL